MLDNVQIKHALISGRIVLAKFGKDKTVALETRDAMPEFWKALASYAFDGKMPEPGAAVEIKFGGGDEQFVLTVSRSGAPALANVAEARITELQAEVERLRAAVIKLGRHTSNCRFYGGHDCSCGLDDIRSAALNTGESDAG